MSRGRELAQWLIQHAARSAPPMLAERLEEEWLADLEARQGLIARLRFGLGCCWATRVIAHEHCAASVPAAAAATGSKTMTAYVRQADTFLSRRTITFALIIGVHVAIIYAFATGLTHPVFAEGPERMRYIPVVDPPPHTEQLPPLPTHQPTLSPKLDPIEKEDIRFDDEDAFRTDQDLTVGPVVEPPRPPPVHIVKRVSGGPGKGFPNTDDFYPPQAIRLHQEGISTVRTCIDERGRLTAAPTLAQSSGTASLDDGALRLARAGSGRYRPTTEDGQPVSSCYEYRVVFHMRD